MSLLSAPDRERLQTQLAQLAAPVRVLFFTQAFGCDTCPEARQILDEVTALTDRVTVEDVNPVLDTDTARTYGVDRTPALALVTDRDTGIRFYGVPAGYEFMSLIDALVLASGGDSGLSEASRALIARVTQPVHIQVFVTPT